MDCITSYYLRSLAKTSLAVSPSAPTLDLCEAMGVLATLAGVSYSSGLKIGSKLHSSPSSRIAPVREPVSIVVAAVVLELNTCFLFFTSA